MELQYYGGNCLKITTKRTGLTVDGDTAKFGAKDPTRDQDVALFTSPPPADYHSKARLVISDPGEYEVSGVSIMGTAVRAHGEEAGTANATVFKIVADDIRLAVLGHIHPKLTDAQLEAIGAVDALCLPVGGGNTLSASEAQAVLKVIESKLIIPTFYKEPGLKYPADTTDLETALKALGMEPAETVPKLKLKSTEFGEGTQLVVLERG